MSLSILCVTRGEPFALAFLRDTEKVAGHLFAEFVPVADGEAASRALADCGHVPYCVDSAGYIESVLDEAVGFCRGDYVLRLDDDERISPAMVRWLGTRAYLGADHWAFPRANLWGDANSVLVNPPLWPDLQTRLSVKAKAGGRHGVHDGSPFGTGRIAPAVIEHHKYLVKDRAQREAQARAYDAARPGAGTDPVFWPHMLPEAAFPEGLRLAPLGDGDAAAINATEAWALAVTR